MRAVVLFVTFVLLHSGGVFADAQADQARKIVDAFKDAVITVKMVITMRMVVEGKQMNESENETETTATIINADGLGVVSLFSTDPTGAFQGMMGQGQAGMPQFNWESEVKDVKMIFGPGKEVPAKIVLRDEDLDLAFIRPLDTLKEPVAAVDLSKAATPRVLDELVMLSRLGKIADRSPSVSLYRLESIIEKPRLFYVPDQAAMASGLGVPAFSLDGTIVGLLLLRTAQAQSMNMSAMLGSGPGMMGMLAVILPAQDIADVVKQVPAPKTDKEK